MGKPGRRDRGKGTHTNPLLTPRAPILLQTHSVNIVNLAPYSRMLRVNDWIRYAAVPSLTIMWVARCNLSGAQGNRTMLWTSLVCNALCGLCQVLQLAVLIIFLLGMDSPSFVEKVGLNVDLGKLQNIIALVLTAALLGVYCSSAFAANKLRENLTSVVVLPVIVELETVKPQPPEGKLVVISPIQ